MPYQVLDYPLLQSSKNKLATWVKSWRWPLVSASVTFAILLPLIFLSLDLTDPGILTVNQMQANRLGRAYFQFNKYLFLSDVVGGWILTLTSSLGLIGLKLAGTVIYSLCALITHRLFQEYVRSHLYLVFATVAAALIASFALFKMSLMIHPNYYTIPMVCALGYIYLSMQFIKKPTLTKAAFLGLFLTFNFFVRSTLIVLALAPLLSLICLPKKNKWFILVTYCSAFFSLLFSAHYLGSDLKSVFSSVEDVFDTIEFHSYSQLFWIYFGQFIKALKLIFILALPFAIPLFLKNKAKMFSFRIAATISLGLVALFLFAPFLPSKLSSVPIKPFKAIWVNLTIVFLQDYTAKGAPFFALILCCCGYISYYLYNEMKSETKATSAQKQRIFLFCTSLIFFAGFLGSSCGIVKGSFGSWLLIVFALVIAEKKKLHQWFAIRTFTCLSLVCLGFLYTHFHQDYLWSLTSLAVHKEGNAKGTVTSKHRQPLIDDLIRYVQQNSSKEDYIFAYHYIPMIYYLVDRAPLMDFSWPVVLKDKALQKAVTKNFSTRKPRLVIRTKFNSFNSMWCRQPKNNFTLNPYYRDRFANKVDYLESQLQTYYNLKLVWSNRAFDVYTPDETED